MQAIVKSGAVVAAIHHQSAASTAKRNSMCQFPLAAGALLLYG